MSIKRIHSGISGNPVHKTGKTPLTGSGSHAISSTRKAAPADKVEISRSPGSSSSGELSHAREILRNLDQNQLESLKEIGKNIDKGIYDTEKVRENIARVVLEDLEAVHPAQGAESKETESEGTEKLSQKRVQFLTQDNDVVQTVTNRMMEDLKQL